MTLNVLFCARPNADQYETPRAQPGSGLDVDLRTDFEPEAWSYICMANGPAGFHHSRD